MKPLVVCLLALALPAAGCLSIGPFTIDPPVHFIEMKGSQTATFYVGMTRCGGLGTPIEDAHHRELLYNGEPVIYGGDEAELIRRAKTARPEGKTEQPVYCPSRYLVHARMHIEKRRGAAPSIPVHIEKDYYVAVIDKLLDVKAEFGK